MKRSYIRRYSRKRNNPFDGHLLKQDQTKDTPFFSAPGKESFIQPATTFIQKKSNGKEEEKDVQKKESSSERGSSSSSIAPFISSLNGKGDSLPPSVNNFFENKMGADFRGVRIHRDKNAASSAKTIGARAYTVGKDIVFNDGEYEPESHEGKKLLAHELTHVMQQTTTPGRKIQRKTGVDDVVEEMRGAEFELVEDQGGIKKGTTIVISDWNGTKDQAYGFYINSAKKIINTMILKRLLKPKSKSVKGIPVYNAGIEDQRTAVNKSVKSVEDQQKKVDDWKTKESNYKKNPDAWKSGMESLQKELERKEGVQEAKEKVMSQQLVQQVMYNKFDTFIKTWVDHYNTTLKPKKNLDYAVVKSIFFQESRMGTSGEHLELPPYSWADGKKNPIRSRFNIGQAIDSWGPNQYLMVKEMSPTIYSKYSLGDLEKGNAWNSMSNDDYAAWNGGKFFDALKEFNSFRDGASKNLQGHGTDLYLDYEFWVRTAVRWLFHKYFAKGQSSWDDAVQAYNGSGKKAQQYRDVVMKRSKTVGDLDVSGL